MSPLGFMVVSHYLGGAYFDGNKGESQFKN